MDMLDDESSNPIGNTSDNCRGSEVDKQELQYVDLGCGTYFEPFEVELQDYDDNVEDFLIFNVKLVQELEVERQTEEHTRKTKKHNPFYVPSKVVREMVSKSGVEWQNMVKPS
ncbi:Nrs1p SKDI_12G1060 [Saccharomyces kudriavzevii IFO 1802]|uniref:YLR053C-like protein n=2 Tax=Saccharomyces kudriavzevii (strain ATCC MYA-4449 / AS 2.2408 / CBS 8840 / NBRC 1802 / NCYC 2889) TaxID=226230 RepID=A0AA35NJW4_SACK1|nr:uncharacterized protein SKDI_12G1060 [Saccharomyces kudriavzevii IFO 1802]CAI4045857.1 hypothetical protein SKDI_12G1060 [Saccharomyces kudriavzevii IFO 1802]